MSDDVAPQPQEMDDADRDRVERLLDEVGGSTTSDRVMLLGYRAILLKDIRWLLGELLAYRQNEVHR